MNRVPSCKVVSLESIAKYTPLLKNGIDTLRLKAGSVILKPGESVGEHTTENREEIVIFLEGKAEVIVEGNDPTVIEGRNAAYIPPHTVHNIKNIGKDHLKYVFAVTTIG